MTTLQDKFNKLYSARAKLEAELNNIYGEINIAVDKQDRKVKIERLIVNCKDAFTRVVDKNEELFDLEQKPEDPDAACKNLENWLETVTKKLMSLLLLLLLLEGISIRSMTKRQQSCIPLTIQDWVHI